MVSRPHLRAYNVTHYVCATTSCKLLYSDSYVKLFYSAWRFLRAFFKNVNLIIFNHTV
jgi:hypothetical protein